MKGFFKICCVTHEKSSYVSIIHIYNAYHCCKTVSLGWYVLCGPAEIWATGQEKMPYLQPAPIEGLHRYVFLLFKQVLCILISLPNWEWRLDHGFCLFLFNFYFHVWKNYVLLNDHAMSIMFCKACFYFIFIFMCEKIMYYWMIKPCPLCLVRCHVSPLVS